MKFERELSFVENKPSHGRFELRVTVGEEERQLDVPILDWNQKSTPTLIGPITPSRQYFRALFENPNSPFIGAVRSNPREMCHIRVDRRRVRVDGITKYSQGALGEELAMPIRRERLYRTNILGASQCHLEIEGTTRKDELPFKAVLSYMSLPPEWHRSEVGEFLRTLSVKTSIRERQRIAYSLKPEEFVLEVISRVEGIDPREHFQEAVQWFDSLEFSRIEPAVCLETGLPLEADAVIIRKTFP